MALKTHNIWKDQDGNPGLYPAGNETSDPDFSLTTWKLLHTFECKTWGEALQIFNDFLGHGEYSYALDEATGLPMDYYFKEFEDN